MKENVLKILRYTKHINSIQLLIAVASGFILFLIPDDANFMLNTPLRELYVGLIAVISTVIILLVFKDYILVGVSLMTCMGLVAIDFIRVNVEFIINNISLGNRFSLTIGYYDGFCAGITWFIPFAICILIRIFAIAKFDTIERRRSFNYLFYCNFICFLVYFAIAFLSLFVFLKPVDILGSRSFNLIPFVNMNSYWPGYDAFYYCFTNLCLFIMLGFFFSIYKNYSSIKNIAVFILLGFSIEVLHLVFNTETIGFDLTILCVLGGILGNLLKLVVNKSRAFITLNEEADIFKDCFKLN